jgi:hypothetical protein
MMDGTMVTRQNNMVVETPIDLHHHRHVTVYHGGVATTLQTRMFPATRRCVKTGIGRLDISATTVVIEKKSDDVTRRTDRDVGRRQRAVHDIDPDPRVGRGHGLEIVDVLYPDVTNRVVTVTNRVVMITSVVIVIPDRHRRDIIAIDMNKILQVN